MSRVLVVDDEPRITGFVSRALAGAGLEVEAASDGQVALELARSGRYDLVVLDLMLPGLDGVEVLRGIVAEDPAPAVLVLSALGDVETRVRCLELGASDYLPKPFALSELLARVRARLRPSERASSRLIVAGGLSLDPVSRVARIAEASTVLSGREAEVLASLMRHPGMVVTREGLLAEVWGYWFDPRSNVVDVYIGRLRAKLGPAVIETVRDAGYRLDPP
jgi:DNA-binding response OmpR family regulator